MEVIKNTLDKKLKASFDDGNIVFCFRVNQKCFNCPKHILIVLRDVKNKIYRLKTMLKGTGIVMKENLTINLLKIVKQKKNVVLQKFGHKQCNLC